MSLTARLFACLILVGFLAAAIFGFGIRQDRAGYDRCQAEHTSAALNQSLSFRADEHQGAIRATENHSEDRQALESAQRSAVAARTELDRLRRVLADRERAASAASTDTRRPDETGERELLGSCAGDIEDYAGEANRLALKVNALQDAIRASCPAAVLPEAVN